MPEAVRLVIWDLDETYWRGTLTEGGILEYVQKNHDAVIELARRGIMSSICSKNDFLAIKNILSKEGIWEYFIFPSIDWSSKSSRIERIVEAVQLRPATVMFIDDNPGNLAEAKARLPELQISDESILSNLLDNPLFRGKSDQELTRLAQYKLLEKRHTDQKSFGDNVEFLRKSNIKVYIENDVEKHIDRAVELINRTNQLNFTKRRLDDDVQVAREQIRKDLQNHHIQAGLVRVMDDYGDYGFVGYFQKSTVWRKIVLNHYCFSCRTLGMGIERWVYDQLGRPELSVRGEVLSDLSDDQSVEALIGFRGGGFGGLYEGAGGGITGKRHWVCELAKVVLVYGGI